jgi:hypothetical protein
VSVGFDAGVDAGMDDGGETWNSDAGWPPPAGTEVCPEGSVHFSALVETFGPCVENSSNQTGPVAGAQVTTLEPWGATTSSDAGTFTLCVPNGVPFTVQFLAPGFAPGYLAELTIGEDETSFGNRIFLLCDPLVTLFSSQAPGWNFNGEGSVLVSIISASETGACDSSSLGLSDWHVQSALPDGGEVAGPTGWQTAYIDETGEVHLASTETFSVGYAVVFNVPASIDMVAVYVDGGPPGVACPSSNPAFGFDGLVHVQPGGFGVFPYIVP